MIKKSVSHLWFKTRHIYFSYSLVIQDTFEYFWMIHNVKLCFIKTSNTKHFDWRARKVCALQSKIICAHAIEKQYFVVHWNDGEGVVNSINETSFFSCNSSLHHNKTEYRGKKFSTCFMVIADEIFESFPVNSQDISCRKIFCEKTICNFQI